MQDLLVFSDVDFDVVVELTTVTSLSSSTEALFWHAVKENSISAAAIAAMIDLKFFIVGSSFPVICI